MLSELATVCQWVNSVFHLMGSDRAGLPPTSMTIIARSRTATARRKVIMLKPQASPTPELVALDGVPNN
jgi:hypothetical protein